MDKYFNRARLITHNKTWSGSRDKNAQKTASNRPWMKLFFIVDLVFENVWRFTFQIAAAILFGLVHLNDSVVMSTNSHCIIFIGRPEPGSEYWRTNENILYERQSTVIHVNSGTTGP